jgi:hypothetical protein
MAVRTLAHAARKSDGASASHGQGRAIWPGMKHMLSLPGE